MKFILLVWLGSGNYQTMAIDHFDTLGECKAVIAALREQHPKFDSDWVRCIPYDPGAQPALEPMEPVRAD